jgi:hypothetical protein
MGTTYANLRNQVLGDIPMLIRGRCSDERSPIYLWLEEAEIQGRFESNLVVRKRLLIKASGRVSGTIRYGQIEIECGGQISGDVQAQPASEHGEILADVASVRVAS